MATDKLAAADTRTPEQVEIDRLRSELDHFTKSGIIEIAVRNPNVSSWMTEWENRALKAEATISALEADNKRLREAVEPFVVAFEKRRDAHSRRYKDQSLGYANFDKMPDKWPMEKIEFTMGDFRRARDLSRNRRES